MDREICVRTVRTRSKPQSGHTSWPLPGVVRTYGDGADGADGPFPVAEGWILVLVMMMVRVRPLPRRTKTISMPTFRKNVAARRTLLDRASGLSGQFLDLATRSPTDFVRATRRSVAVPVHTVRGCAQGANSGGDRICLNDGLDRLVAVAVIGRLEGSGGP